jgi:dTMP kinase
MSGIFITLEGIEGCGKTTQIRLLEEFLKGKNYDVVTTREPGGTRIGDQIRRVLLVSENKEMAPIAELLLYAAARNQHIEEVIKPALERGQVVICDRYADATTAYQGAARKINPEYLVRVHEIATGGLQPQLTLLLDCPPHIGLERAIERNEQSTLHDREDRFEKESLEFHESVRQGYLRIANNEPDRLRVIDATRAPESIHQDIVKEVMRVLS